MTTIKFTDEKIKELYNELLEDGKYTPQNRGYIFEKLITAKLENEHLEPRASYKPKGEQVDGSFFWEGQTYLLEAKWVKDKLSASSIYAFKGKLDGKFHTTSGVFLSVNGYNEDVEDALKFGKALNILLFDYHDISLIFNNEVSFLEVLKFKLREAGDTGSLNVPYELKEQVETLFEEEDIHYLNIPKFSTKYSKKSESTDILMFVEGPDELVKAKKLLNSLEFDYPLAYKIVVLEGLDNIRQIPSLINLYGNYHHAKAIIVFIDKEEITPKIKSLIEMVTNQLENSSIPIDTKFLFVDKNQGVEYNETFEILKEERGFGYKKKGIVNELKSFIGNILEEYYEYETYQNIPYRTFRGVMDSAHWDYENSEISFTEDSGFDTYIKNTEDLVDYLNNEAVSEMDGSMPLSWLKSVDYLDYQIEAKEFLFENYLEELRKMKWDVKNL